MDYDGAQWAISPATTDLLGARPHPAVPLPRPPRIVALGGGTGLPVVLEGLASTFRRSFHFDPALDDPLDTLTAIVTVTDDGGSSGWVRRELGTLPPGDIRNCLAALSDASPLVKLLQHRFGDVRGLSEQSVGNLLLAALTQMTGDFAQAVEQLSSLLQTRGRVLPSTSENVTLRAEFISGDVVNGETAIASHGQRIHRLSLERPVRPLPEALRAIINADAIVVGPGSLYTSVLPNLLIGGIAPTLSGVDGIRICVANLMTEPGETDGFSLDDHLAVIRDHVGTDLFDYVLVNTGTLSETCATHLAAAGCHLIAPTVTLPSAGGAEIITGDFIDERPDGAVRHRPDALAAAVLDVVRRGRCRKGPRSD